jgi:hypothetical protein
MSGIGWKNALRRPAAPGGQGNPQLRRVAARFLSPGPQGGARTPVQRQVGREVQKTKYDLRC